MRGNSGICLFCRHAFSLRTSPIPTKRFASNRHGEPYVLPRLVIDLDAADSKHVRKADELTEWHPLGSVQMEEEEPDLETRKPHHQPLPFPNQAPKTLKVTPPDLLAFALMGDPTHSQRSVYQLRQIYRYLRIHADDSIHSKALQLTSDFNYNPEERLEFQQSDYAAYRRQMGNGAREYPFHAVARMVSFLSTTKEGCSFLAEEGKVLFHTIRRARKTQKDDSQEVTLEMVLGLYNDLRISMESKGVKFNSLLACSGLYYASKRWNLPSIRTYLELCSKNNRAPEDASMFWPTTSKALLALMIRLIYEPEMYRRLGLETLKLITGWEDSPTGSKYDRDPASFMCCFQEAPSYISGNTYLAGLAELKSKDTLEAEWNADSKNAIGKNIWDLNPRTKNEIFALAFHLAGSTDDALRVLYSPVDTDVNNSPDPDIVGPKEMPDPIKPSQTSRDIDRLFFATSGGGGDQIIHEEATKSQSEADAKSGDATPQPPRSLQRIRILTSFYIAHYEYHNVKASENLLAELVKALMNSPEDPQQFLDMAENFFLRDYRAPVGPLQPVKLLQWVDEDNARGLAVYDKDTDEAVHWKAALRAVENGDVVSEESVPGIDVDII